LKGWRAHGQQRGGYIYGTYTPYDNIPLGIKVKKKKQKQNKHKTNIKQT